jgi:hypothetical protein
MYNFVQKYCRSLYVCISRLSFDHFTIVWTSVPTMFKHRGKRHRRRKACGSCLMSPFPPAAAVLELSRGSATQARWALDRRMSNAVPLVLSLSLFLRFVVNPLQVFWNLSQDSSLINNKHKVTPIHQWSLTVAHQQLKYDNINGCGALYLFLSTIFYCAHCAKHLCYLCYTDIYYVQDLSFICILG